MLAMPEFLRRLWAGDDPSSRTLAARTGTDLAAARARLDRGDLAPDTVPFTPLLGLAGPAGALDERRPVARWVSGVVGRLLEKARPVGGPVLAALEMEVTRQAVLFDGPAQSSAVVLTVLSLDEQLAAAGAQLRREYRTQNQGGELLRVTLATAQAAADGVRVETALSPRQLSWGSRPADPQWTTDAVALWETAGRLAEEQGAPATGTSHLVAAIRQAPAPAARRLLAAVGAG